MEFLEFGGFFLFIYLQYLFLLLFLHVLCAFLGNEATAGYHI